jgi:uncharacterized protein
MSAAVRDAPQAQRYEIHADGTLAGFAEYRRRPGLIAFTHTEVDDAYEGRGLASALIRHALDQARGEGLAVLPFCPFVNGYIARHAEYADLVPGGFREQFGV